MATGLIAVLRWIALGSVVMSSASYGLGSYAPRYTGRHGIGHHPRSTCTIRIREAVIEVQFGVRATLSADYGNDAFDRSCAGRSRHQPRAPHDFYLEQARLDVDEIHLRFADCATATQWVEFDGTITRFQVQGTFRFSERFRTASESRFNAVDVPQTLDQNDAPNSGLKVCGPSGH